MKGKTVRCLAAVVAGMLLCTGCTLDVEAFLQPPRVQGEQQAVQEALDTYIRDTGVGQRYTLQYPSQGDYTSAFVLCDQYNRPTDEGDKAALAVAFYVLSSAPEETHVNLLRRQGKEWISAGDSVGYGADIRQVAFGDLDGDGVAELLTGWSTYNSQNHRLGVFSVGAELTPLSGDRVYTQLFAGDMTAAGHDSLLLLHIGSAGRVTASLETLEEGRLETVSTVRLDGGIQQFGRMTLCDLGDVRGLYVDAAKSAGTTITELLYYDDTGLHAPFYNPDKNETTVTARATGLYVRDVDGDGMAEVPFSTSLTVGELPEDTTGWLTVWRAYDLSAGSWVDRLYTVVNTADGYLVSLDPERRSGLATVYDPVGRTLDLKDKKVDRVWLRLCAGEDAAPAQGMEQVELFQATSSLPGCVAWYDPAVLDEAKVRYMVVRLTDREGE